MKAEHYYTEKPSSQLKLYKLSINLLGFDFEFYTSTGVFSYSRVDKATLLLVNNMAVKPGLRVLDLGCGYGVIGVVASRLGCDVVMSDVNERALMLALRNVKFNRVKALVIKSDLFSNVAGDFDSVITNPPIAVGMEFNYRLIQESFNHLRIGGSLQLVARHNKGGARLKGKMMELFGNVEDLVKKGGFRVYYSVKGKHLNLN